MLDQLSDTTRSDAATGRAEPETERSHAKRSEGGGAARIAAA
jgi:hypothetical protein